MVSRYYSAGDYYTHRQALRTAALITGFTVLRFADFTDNGSLPALREPLRLHGGERFATDFGTWLSVPGSSRKDVPVVQRGTFREAKLK